MNKVYKVIWSSVKGCYIVVSELAHQGRNKTKSLKAVCALTALLFAGSMGLGQLEAQAAEDSDKTTYGFNAKVEGSSGTAVGSNAKVTGDNGTALGDDAGVDGIDGTAVGHNAKVEGSSGTAIGQGASVTGDSGGTAIGKGASVNGNDSTAVGRSAIVTGNNSTALGVSAKVDGGSGTAVGSKASVAGENGTALGVSANITGEDSTALGHTATVTGKNSTAVGSYAYIEVDNSIAIGSASKVFATDMITADEFAAWKQAHTEYAKFDIQNADSEYGVFSIGSENNERRIINVANGRIDANSTDAINGSQLFGALEYLDGRIGDTSGIKRSGDDQSGYTTTIEGGVSFSSGGAMTNVSSINGVRFGIGNTTITLNGNTFDFAQFKDRIKKLEDGYGELVDGGSGGNTTVKGDGDGGAGNIHVVDQGQNGNHDYIVSIDPNPEFNKISANKAEIGDVTIEGDDIIAGDVVIDGTTGTVSSITGNFQDVNVEDSLTVGSGDNTVTIDGGNVNATGTITAEDVVVKDNQGKDVSLSQAVSSIGNMEQSIAGLDGRINKVDDKVNKVGAGAAALAALHPLDFDSDDKLTFSAGVGHYEGETAAALGAFYRPDEKVMFSLGGTVGNGEDMINAGISFALDRTSNVKTSKEAMAQRIVELEAQVAQLTALVNQVVERESKK